MFTWMTDFYQRHRKKLITLGVVTGGAYISYKLAEWKLAEWRQREIEEYRRQAKKQFHYESNQRTCVKTFMQLMVPMRDKIYEALNVEEITNALSQNPENKLALWEDLKLLGFTRAVTSVIATCTLYVFLQVQMNIIAGYMYLEKTEASEEASEVNELIHEIEMDVPISDLQKEYLNNIKFLFNDGIFQMIDHVKAFTNDIVGPISLKSKLSHYELSQMILSIWDHFKLGDLHEQLSKAAAAPSVTPVFSKYILDVEECKKKTNYFDEEKYQQIMAETFDVVESEDFQTVLLECVHECMEHVLQSIEPHFQNVSSPFEEGSDISSQMNECKLPFAKLIPIVNAQSNLIFKAGKNEFLETLFSMECVTSFSANIYESFSLEKR